MIGIYSEAFCHLIGTGGVMARNDIRSLQSFIKTDDPINLISGLQQLEQLNLVSILQNIQVDSIISSLNRISSYLARLSLIFIF